MMLLTYNCQIGEKPGVPAYVLEVSQEKITVERLALISGGKKEQFQSKLSETEIKELKTIASSFPKNFVGKGQGLAGHFQLKYSDGVIVKELKGTSDKRYPELHSFEAWVKSLHKKHAELSSIRPIFPGEEIKE